MRLENYCNNHKKIPILLKIGILVWLNQVKN